MGHVPTAAASPVPVPCQASRRIWGSLRRLSCWPRRATTAAQRRSPGRCCKPGWPSQVINKYIKGELGDDREYQPRSLINKACLGGGEEGKRKGAPCGHVCAQVAQGGQDEREEPESQNKTKTKKSKRRTEPYSCCGDDCDRGDMPRSRE